MQSQLRRSQQGTAGALIPLGLARVQHFLRAAPRVLQQVHRLNRPRRRAVLDLFACLALQRLAQDFSNFGYLA